MPAATTDPIRVALAHLVDCALPDGDADRIDELRALEELKCAAEARQARIAVEFDASQRAKAAAHGVRAERQGRGVAHQVALARRESPHRGQLHLGLAKALQEMPHTMAAFREGRISEWRATILVRETACVALEHRAQIDKEMAGDPEALERYGDRELAGKVRLLAARLDAKAVAERRRNAEDDRRVTIRPAPDTMAYVTGLLPVKDAVAMFAALKADAERALADGTASGRNQAMADAMVARITGREPGASTPVQVNLVMSDQALLAGAHDTAHIAGWGPVPANLVRELLADALDADVETAVTRLYARPDTGELVAMESRARLFPKALARFLQLRDRFCRNLWCDSPIRHRDHVVAVVDGGETSADNGQGLCEACNHAKQAPGWDALTVPGVRHTVETTTPTGHTYRSQAPPIVDTPDHGPPRWPVTRLTLTNLAA